MRTRIISLFTGILLFTACTGSVDSGPASTPDPLLMDPVERTIWDFENFRNEVNALAAAAADTPVEDLEPIARQMTALAEEIWGYEYPLFAAQAQSALYNFAVNTEQCYIGKFMEEISDQEMMGFYEERCDQAQVYKETLDLYLQELKEMNAGE